MILSLKALPAYIFTLFQFFKVNKVFCILSKSILGNIEKLNLSEINNTINIAKATTWNKKGFE